MENTFDVKQRLATMIFLLFAALFACFHIAVITDKTVYNMGSLIFNYSIIWATFGIYLGVFVYLMIVYNKKEKWPLLSKVCKFSSLALLIFHLVVIFNAFSTDGGIQEDSFSFVDAIPFAAIMSLAVISWNEGVFIDEQE